MSGTQQAAQALGGPGGQLGGGQPGGNPLAAQANAATRACGQLVQTLKRIPGVDQAAVEAAGKSVGESIMALLAVAKPRGQQGPPA